MTSPDDPDFSDLTAMRAFRVGDWLIQPSLNRMTDNGNAVHVEPRIVRVLVCLASRPGEVISRDELLRLIWGDVVVGEEVLTVAVSELRRILGDDAKAPRYIETIRKGGYRLVATVSAEAVDMPTNGIFGGGVVDTAGGAMGDAIAHDGAARPTAQVRGTAAARADRRVLGWLIPVAIVLVLVGTWTIWNQNPRSVPSAGSQILRGTPFTTYTGSESYPAMSPDGTQVAFAWGGQDEDNLDIYIKQRNTESPLRLTSHPAAERYPTWSPDGSTLAFVRFDEECAIYAIPSIGGAERRLAVVEPYVGGIDWSPDGGSIAVSDASRPTDSYLIALLSLDTLEFRPLTSPQPQFNCDFAPAFSPDGETVAFVRGGYGFERDIFLVPTAGGEARPLTEFQRQVSGLDWTADGKEIVFSAAPTGHFGLWRARVADGSVHWLPTTGDWAMRPSIAAGSGSLVYEELIHDCDILQSPIRLPGAPRGAGAHSGDPSTDPDTELAPALIASTRIDYGPEYSPDGTRIAFISARSGHREIWLCERDGTRPRELTNFGGTYVTRPRWSPDGTQLVFTATPEGYATLYIVDVEGGATRRLSNAPRHETSPRWSSDGETLYFAVDAGNAWQIWRMSVGGGERECVSREGQHPIGVSRDGSYLYCYRRIAAGAWNIWQLALPGGEATCVVGQEQTRRWVGEEIVDDGVYAIVRNPIADALTFLDFATGTTDTLAALPVRAERDFAISPDRQQILICHTDRYESDLVLVEGLE